MRGRPVIPEEAIITGTFSYDLNGKASPAITADFPSIGYSLTACAGNRLTVIDTDPLEEFSFALGRCPVFGGELTPEAYFGSIGIILTDTNPEVNALSGSGLPLRLSLDDFTGTVMKATMWNTLAPGSGTLEAQITGLTQQTQVPAGFLPAAQPNPRPRSKKKPSASNNAVARTQEVAQ